MPEESGQPQAISHSENRRGLRENEQSQGRDRSTSELVDEAPCVAWVQTFGWIGPPDLLGRIARAAIEAVEKFENTPAACSILVRVPLRPERSRSRSAETRFDVERFESPRAFLDEVTDDALRRFSSIGISVSGGRTSVDVKVLRDRGIKKLRAVAAEVFLTIRRVLSLPEAPEEGVYLWVESTDPAATKQVLAVRDHVLAAIARGHSRWRHAPHPELGHRNPFESLQSSRRGGDPRDALSARVTLGAIVIGAILLTKFGLPGLLGRFEVDLALGLAMGLVLSFGLFLALPAVEVSARTRIGQAGRVGLRVGLLIAGPLLSIVARRLAG